VFAQTAFGIAFLADVRFAELLLIENPTSENSAVIIEYGPVPSSLATPVAQDDWWQLDTSKNLWANQE